MRTLSGLLFLLAFCSSLVAQETTHENRGTIRVQKRGQPVKTQFDNVNYRLLGMDQYGNILDSTIMEFQMSVRIKGIFYTEKTVGQNLSFQMQQLLGRCDQSSKIFFDKIKAKDKYGNIIELPKFQCSFGYSEENTE